MKLFGIIPIGEKKKCCCNSAKEESCSNTPKDDNCCSPSPASTDSCADSRTDSCSCNSVSNTSNDTSSVVSDASVLEGESTTTIVIKVLGAGCKSCHKQFENVKEAVSKEDFGKYSVEYVIDMEKVMAYGVMHMPAIVVNESVVNQGSVLSVTEVKKLLKIS